MEERLTLQTKLRELLANFCGGSGQPPVSESLRIAEVTQQMVSETGGYTLRRSQLQTPEQYSERFAELVSADYAWLRVSFCGNIEGHGLVLVNYPRAPYPKPVSTPVVFSGPPRCVAEAGWDARAYVTILPQ